MSSGEIALALAVTLAALASVTAAFKGGDSKTAVAIDRSAASVPHAD